MEEKRVIVIDEETFREKTLEVIDYFMENLGPTMALAVSLFSAKLHCKLFKPEEVPERTEQNDA